MKKTHKNHVFSHCMSENSFMNNLTQEDEPRAKTSILAFSLVNQFSDLALYSSAIWPVSFPIMKTSVTLHSTDIAYATTDCKNNLMWHVVKYKRSVTACGYTVKYGVESIVPVSN